MPFPAFDRSRLHIQPLANRQHDLDLSVILPLDAPLPDFTHPALPVLGRRLAEARQPRQCSHPRDVAPMCCGPARRVT